MQTICFCFCQIEWKSRTETGFEDEVKNNTRGHGVRSWHTLQCTNTRSTNQQDRGELWTFWSPHPISSGEF